MDKYNLDEFDKFIDEINKKDIEVPDELNNRIDKKIDRLNPKKKYLRNIMLASLSFIIIFTGLIRYSDVGIYAAEIPVLKPIVELIRGDRGIENAIKHGYKKIPDVTIEEDGYVIELSNIYMDEDRISLTSVIKGNRVDRLEKENENIGNIEENHINLSFNFTDFESRSVSMESIEDEFLGRKVEQTFRKIGEVEEFLNINTNHLNLKIKIYKEREVLQAFNDIKIPIEKENIKLSKKYDLNEKYQFEQGKIYVRELAISPTRMRLALDFDMKENYFFNSFENHYLKDEKGNIYKPEGLISTGLGSNKRVMYFVPSLYFDKIPEKLYFCFDGIRIGTEEGKEFRLYLEGQYPKTIEYMGEEIVIKDVEWDSRGELRIIYRVPEDDILEFQSIGPVEGGGYRSWTESVETDENGNEIKYIVNSFPTEKQEYYDLVFEYPGYLIPNKEQIEIRIK